MDKVEFMCWDCNKKFVIQYNEIADLKECKCKHCNSDNIFIQKFIFEKPPKKTELRFGERGCGTNGRFK